MTQLRTVFSGGFFLLLCVAVSASIALTPAVAVLKTQNRARRQPIPKKRLPMPWRRGWSKRRSPAPKNLASSRMWRSLMTAGI